ncbi:MAG: transcriptional regulator [Actinobacteria bacterium]|nr:transcriptional regulator [Actinomycetota bacterium]
MQIDQDVKSELVTRLNRIEGQIRGIEKMLEDDRECRDIVTQIAAATKALETVGFRMLASGPLGSRSLPSSSHRRSATARSLAGCRAKRSASLSLILPPCISRLRTEASESVSK